MYGRSYRKKAGSRKKEKTPLDKAHDKLRKLVSEYVRKRDVDRHGMGVCRTCRIAWKK